MDFFKIAVASLLFVEVVQGNRHFIIFLMKRMVSNAILVIECKSDAL